MDPRREPLPKNRREFAKALLRCRATTYRHAAAALERRGRAVDPEEVRQNFLSYAADGEHVPGGDLHYAGQADADGVDAMIKECLT